jgi:DNA-binding response OmpR family regulator
VLHTNNALNGPVTVLVAEDDEPIRLLIARSLWEEGYRTIEARDGAEALHLAHLALPHLQLVITDVVMPNLDGRELGRRLATACPSLPVLYISAYPSGDIFRRDGPSGAAFLQKPFSVDELTAAVRTLLESRAVKPQPPLSELA